MLKTCDPTLSSANVECQRQVVAASLQPNAVRSDSRGQVPLDTRNTGSGTAFIAQCLGGKSPKAEVSMPDGNHRCVAGVDGARQLPQLQADLQTMTEG